MPCDDPLASEPGLGPPASPPRRPAAILAIGALTLLLAAGWVALRAIRTDPRSPRAASVHLLTIDRPFPAEGRFPGDPYLGSKACAECHPGESALHARSGHASTLRPAGRIALARRLDGTTLADPELPAARWSYRYHDGGLELSRTAGYRVERWIVDYAFGSGHHATTFVNVLDPSIPAILEHRLTYYTREDELNITPGHDADSRGPEVKPHGNEPSPRNGLKCFRCHATQISAHDDPRLDEQEMLPNISCERCHGPGRAHAAAARRGAPEEELAMPFGLDRWTAESQMMLCGTCHRHPSRAQPGQIRRDDPHLARFQPVGIMQSRCYRASQGAFTCLSCHDPHARVSADRASYNTVCLSCHAGGVPTPPMSALATPSSDRLESAGAPCPAAPRGACVECHMPRVESGQHILFTDHWIRIRRPGETSTTTRRPLPSLDLLDGRPTPSSRPPVPSVD